MNSAIVIGGGWAGLSCAVHLAEKGYRVTLLEQSGRLGGRASSFLHDKTGDPVDNGQHLFMGCYESTIRFLKKIGSLDKLKFQENLSVDFVRPGGKVSSLRCSSLPSPFHLFHGLLKLDTLTFSEKTAMVKVYAAVKKWSHDSKPISATVDSWLGGLGQDERSRRYFWDPITLATLNERADIAEADSLAIVLAEAFFRRKEHSRIAISTVGLSELCGPPSERFLKERNGVILKNKLVSRIVIEGDSVRSVTLRDGSSLTADVVVSAVPFFILGGLLGPVLDISPFFSKVRSLSSSPIFSISLWFDREITDREFVGMLDTQTQWLFNKSRIFNLAGNPGVVSLVISGAHEFLGRSDDQMVDLCLKELQMCFPLAKGARLKERLVQREKNATLSPKIGFYQHRLSQRTPIKNFFLCGDWTDTGFPATIESAVLSTEKVASYV